MNAKELNQLNLEDARRLGHQLDIGIIFQVLPQLQPGLAMQAAAKQHPGYVLVPDGQYWKGKPTLEERFWIKGLTPEEVLWKIALATAT